MSEYATPEDVKAYLRIPDGDTIDDDEIASAIVVASSQIDHLCSQTFTPYDPDELPVDYGYHYDVPVWDSLQGAYVLSTPPMSSGSFSVYLYDPVTGDYDDEVDYTGFNGLRPLNGGPPAGVWSSLLLPTDSTYSPNTYNAGSAENTVLVRAPFGWTETPAPVRQACLIQSARILARRDAKFGIVNSPDGSSMARLQGAVDTDVAVMLRPYVKYWVVR